jgi:hypothetical protein
MGFNPRSHCTKCPKSLVLSKVRRARNELTYNPVFKGTTGRHLSDKPTNEMVRRLISQ